MQRHSPQQRQTNPDDGTFSLFHRDGWAYLSVSPPVESGHPVYAEDVENRMRLLGMPKVSRTRVREIIEAGLGSPEPLVAWPEGRKLAARVEVTISDDSLEAYLSIEPPRKGGAPPSRADLEKALESAGVVFGIDDSVIRRAVEGAGYNRPLLVARGLPVVHERAARLECHFNTDRLRPYLTMPFDRINLKELNFIEHCREGQLLAELTSPVAPVEGKTVGGEPIPAEREHERVEIPSGENTELSDDGNQLYALCDGNVRFDNQGIICVEPVVTVANVNYETGNIRFDGSLIVEGSIADGFVVEAGGDLQVGKGVGRATVRAGRNLVLKTGMNGNTEGSLACGGDLYARFLESCRASCDGHLFVEEAIMHVELICGKHCMLGGRRAEIIGGEAIVGGSLWCKKVGNVNEVRTRVAVSVAPSILGAYYKSSRDLEKAEEDLGAAEESLTKLDRAIREGRSEERVLQARSQVAADVTRLRAERSRLRREVPECRDRVEPASNAILVAENAIFPGVVVAFGTHEYRPSGAGSHKTILHLTPSGVQESGFDLRNPPALSFEE